jgi:uncharacterized protein (TIGR02145 family)
LLFNNFIFNQLKKKNMKKRKAVVIMTGVLLLLFSFANISGQSLSSAAPDSDQTAAKQTQTVTKSSQAKSKTQQATTKSKQTSQKPAKAPAKSGTVAGSKESGTIRIGSQTWAAANLNVNKFRNGDSIPEARTFQEWVKAGEDGKPAWCYYNNDPANGTKYGRLYNWYAVNDPRGLAPSGWSLPNDSDWSTLIRFLGGPGIAGGKMKCTKGWADGDNGTNESGFNAFPAGYRVENGKFLNFGLNGAWWSSQEDNSRNAIDRYLSQGESIGRGINPKQRGESVRCIKK